jgi:hypothetical protein
MFDPMTPAMIFEECGEDKTTYEVYLLNPGNIMQGFGGTRQGLLVRKTASLILRCKIHGSVTDVEYDLRDENAWKTIQWANENCARRMMGVGSPR